MMSRMVMGMTEVYIYAMERVHQWNSEAVNSTKAAEWDGTF